MAINNLRYLNWITKCNCYDLSLYSKFIVEDITIGYVHHSHLDYLKNFQDYLKVSSDKITFMPNYHDHSSRTFAMKVIVDKLFSDGVFKSLVGEDYDVMKNFGDPILFQMERAATSFFGIHKYGVHINGYVIKNNQYYMWVATRAKDKPMWPGKLDHIVAGGHSTGMTIEETMRKECAEEANISEELLTQSRPVGYVNYIMDNKKQLSRDALFIYDICLPESFIPENTDGEVDEFNLLPIEEVLSIVNNTDQYKLNCNLVVIDFAIRHGFIKPDEAYYSQIVKGLRVSPIC